MALVGLTGSGKTTMVELAGRLYDVTGGAVKLDGVDIRDLTRQELRTHIAMAFEDATLFSASVRDNVLLGRPGRGRRRRSSRRSRSRRPTFVYDLPEGLDTRIGEEGLSLSGGQRQRLALARAVAANPAVLVLDDPLSALDVDTEALVEAALRRVLTRTTALIVAHRPSTVQLADRVALIEEGRILDVGTHSELLARSDHYRFVISSSTNDRSPTGRRCAHDRRDRCPGRGARRGPRPRRSGSSSAAARVRLLGSLLRPLRGRLVWTLGLVIVSTALQALGPARDRVGHRHRPARAPEGDGAAAARRRRRLPRRGRARRHPDRRLHDPDRPGSAQAILIDLRKRVFLQTQRLSLEFHETYTSGRIISRQTSDLDSIRELLDGGVNELVMSVLYMLFIAVGLVLVDPTQRPRARLLVPAARPAAPLVPAAGRRRSSASPAWRRRS